VLLAGKPPAWLRCPVLPRLFLLELLESVLLHRAPAFQANPVLAQLLNDEVRCWLLPGTHLGSDDCHMEHDGLYPMQNRACLYYCFHNQTSCLLWRLWCQWFTNQCIGTIYVMSTWNGATARWHCSHKHPSTPPLQVCPQLQQLATRALDPEVEPASAAEGRLILRCATAVLRKHTDAVQDAAPPLLSLLIDGCMPGRWVAGWWRGGLGGCQQHAGEGGSGRGGGGAAIVHRNPLLP
jgi:hypothetical protein